MVLGSYGAGRPPCKVLLALSLSFPISTVGATTVAQSISGHALNAVNSGYSKKHTVGNSNDNKTLVLEHSQRIIITLQAVGKGGFHPYVSHQLNGGNFAPFHKDRNRPCARPHK